jgi:hypothetical protein
VREGLGDVPRGTKLDQLSAHLVLMRISQRASAFKSFDRDATGDSMRESLLARRGDYGKIWTIGLRRPRLFEIAMLFEYLSSNRIRILGTFRRAK